MIQLWTGGLREPPLPLPLPLQVTANKNLTLSDMAL